MQREANCIGLVKLMGRHCGFIAMNAALAARDVDICHLAQKGGAILREASKQAIPKHPTLADDFAS